MKRRRTRDIERGQAPIPDVEENGLARRGKSERRRPLTVGILIASPPVPRWIATVVSRAEADATLCPRVFTVEVERCIRTRFAFAAYEALDARIFSKRGDALELVELRPSSPESRLGRLHGGGLSAKDVETLAAAELDVIVDLVGMPRADTAARAGMYGVWKVEHTDERGATGDTWLFEPTRRGRLVRTTLVAETVGGRTILYESYGAADRVSLRRTRNAACSKGVGAILNRLRALHAERSNMVETESRIAPPANQREDPPTAGAVARHVVSAGSGVIARRLRKLVAHEEWFIAVRPRGLGDDLLKRTGAFTPLPNLRSRYFADPFPFIDDGRLYLFLESYSRKERRGSIWFVRTDGSGHPVGQPRLALEREYHLSYPFLFRHRNEVFMIPETADNGTIDLYRATRFPDEWRLEQTLLSGIRSVDSTVFVADERLYLFTNLAEPGASLNDELHLFWASDPTGPWRFHRANPIVADVRSARPAGRIFRDDRRQLVRPSQDCSVVYGGAIVLNRIETLTPQRYQESVIGRIDPEWAPGLTGTHTLNATKTVVVVDGRRFRARGPFTRPRRWDTTGPT